VGEQETESVPQSWDLIQIGWRDRDTGEMCDCPVYEGSPHRNSEPVLVTRDAYERLKGKVPNGGIGRS
jgi:hypothetical protein